MTDRQPILVTGTHRSGTTWVGRMLAASPAVAYIEEPFGLLHRRGICDVDFSVWFPYIGEHNEDLYVHAVSEMLEFRYKTASELRTVRSPRDAARLVRDRWRFGRYRRRRLRPLLKDPIAVFSAEWLAERFGADVVVTIRHPAGFVSSLIRLGWTHPFDHFLRQPRLIRDHLAPFEEQIRASSEEDRPLLDQAILLWNLIHHVVLEYRGRHPDWTFVRHEDLSADPIAGFENLYRRVGLPFDATAEAVIARHSSGPDSGAPISPFDVRRDSRSAASVWRTRLGREQIERIRSGVEPLARAFYSDAEWEGTIAAAPERGEPKSGAGS